MDFSYQLYSSRKFPPLANTLKMLAKFGYSQVEGFGGLYGPGADVGALRALLDEHGLAMPTGHMALDAIEGDPAGVIATARSLGIEAVFAPHISAEGRPADAAGWAAFGKRVAEAGKPILDAGFKFGWHNHAFEFDDLGVAEKPLDMILAGSDDLSLELDLAWVRVGGGDPVAWTEKYADRLISVHLKDIAPEGECADEDGWADVGHGTMDWATLVPALEAAEVTYWVMEHDNPKDDARFARRSIAMAQTL